MAVWVCRDCTAAYSVGAPQCPQCGSTDRIEEEEQNMPKITVAGGPSIAGITGAWGDGPESDAEGSEEPSQTSQAPGTGSSPSEPKPDSEPETSSSGGSKRARTTESRGGRARTGSSSAHSTDTAPTARTSETDSDKD